MKAVYVIIFIATYIFLLNNSKYPNEDYSVFFIILFLPTSFVIAWVIPQLFKDAIVPFLIWLAKFIPKS